MITKLGVVVLVCFCHLTAYTQHKQKVFKIYVYGAYFPTLDSCELKVDEKYGVKRVWGGCMTTKSKTKKDAKSHQKLILRNGEFWNESYKTELSECHN